MALSLTVLQEKAVKVDQALPDELTYLGGMNRIHGFMVEPDGELLLLGDRNPKAPPVHLDDMAVALRNAYKVGPVYEGVLGCTIDPWSRAKDPWRIHEIKIFGAPPSPMLARHVALDAELKKVSAGILSLGNGVRSLWELNRSTTPPCEGPLEKDQMVEASHRFWFTSLYPPPPRFLEEDGMVLILKPVRVQLLSEQEFRDRKARRTGSAQSSPAAEKFAQLITDLLATSQHYGQLITTDFRTTELGALMRFKRIPVENLRYLLYNYPLSEVEIPSFVGGIRREERGEVVCGAELTERRTANGNFITSKELVKRYHFKSRGGVEAKVNIVPDHFVKEHSGGLADLHHRVQASRPSVHALQWEIRY